MEPIKFEGHNVVIAENQKEYLPLPAHVAEDGTVTTVWQLTMEERTEVLNNGRLYIRQLTFNHPLQPICPSVVPFTDMQEEKYKCDFCGKDLPVEEDEGGEDGSMCQKCYNDWLEDVKKCPHPPESLEENALDPSNEENWVCDKCHSGGHKRPQTLSSN